MTSMASIRSVLPSIVSVCCSVLILFSLGSYLKLVGLMGLHGAWPALAFGLASVLAATRFAPARETIGTFARRMLLLAGLVLAGPAWLTGYQYTTGAPASWDFLGLSVLVALLLGPEWARLWKLASAFVFEPERVEDPEDDTPRSWLLSWGGLALTLSLLAIAKPYTGRLGAHCLMAIGWGCWILPRTPLLDARKLLALWSTFFLGFAALLMFFFINPLPQPSYGMEIIYTDAVMGQPVTVLARKNESAVTYSVITKQAMVHNTYTAYRHAESMIHPAMALSKGPPRKILVLGSEDGAMVRELAKYPHAKEISWVPIYPYWREFFEQAPLLGRGRVGNTPSTKVVRAPVLPSFSVSSVELLLDEYGKKAFDLIVADFPHPGSKHELHHRGSYQIIEAMLKPKGLIVMQLASPYQQRKMYWCLVSRWARAMHVVPYSLSPSLYLDFGYVLVSRHRLKPFARPLKIPVKTKYLYATQPFSVLARFSKQTAPDGRDMGANCMP